MMKMAMSQPHASSWSWRSCQMAVKVKTANVLSTRRLLPPSGT